MFGIEMTGPWDAHTLASNGEPFWSHRVVRTQMAGSPLVMGSIDPIYHMKVNFSATLIPAWRPCR